MSSADQLRSTVAEFFDVPETQVGPAFSLRRSSDSVARAALDAAIRRRVGLISRSVYKAATYGEIESELFPGGGTPAAVEVSPAPRPDPSPPGPTPAPAVATASCGVDIELIENLPRADDYWASPYYRTNFAPPEIADCLRRETPAEHFAARWCAKEALKKCDRAFFHQEMNRIEVVTDEAGAPYLIHHVDGTSRRLPHAVSLSHTPHAAVAVVVKVDTPAVTPSVVPEPSRSSSLPAPRAAGGISSALSLLVSLAALALAALALYRNTRPGG